jgi:hypothetical protein
MRYGIYKYKIQTLNMEDEMVIESNRDFTIKEMLSEYYHNKHDKNHPFTDIFKFIYKYGTWSVKVVLINKTVEPKYKEMDRKKYLNNREYKLQKAKEKNSTLDTQDILNRRIQRKLYRNSDVYKQYMKEFREKNKENRNRQRRKRETPNVRHTKIETAKIETAKIETAKIETAKIETAKIETAKIETAKIQKAIRSKKYNDKNKDKNSIRSKERYMKNRDAIRQQQKEYYHIRKMNKLIFNL